MSRPPVDTVVVTWRAAPVVGACREALRQAGIARRIVVDNASDDGTAEAVRQTDPEALLLRMPGNLGFAAACNRGLAESRAPFVLLVNPDAVLQAGALQALLEEAMKHPRAGLLGPLILNSAGRPAWDCARGFPTLLDRLLTDTLAAVALPGLRRFRRDLQPTPDTAREVPALSGACLLVRREALEQAGALDEDFFLYFEDLDWCRRIGAAGWACRVVPAARLIHVGGASASTLLARSYLENRVSEIRYFRKHGSRGAVIGLKTCRWMDGLCRILLDVLLWPCGGRRRLSKDLAAMKALAAA